VSCEACHIGSPSGGNASYPIASTYRAGLNLANSDSDGDGFTNKQEANGSSLNFNSASATPFTLQTAAAFLGTNARVITDAGAAETAFIDSYSMATGSQVILGGVKVTLNAADTIYFKAGGVNATDSVYTVDASNFGTLVASTDWSAGTDGSLHILALPAAAGSADYVVVHTAAAVTSGTQPNGEDEEGCLVTNASTTLLMMFALLAMGLILRRKNNG